MVARDTSLRVQTCDLAVSCENKQWTCVTQHHGSGYNTHAIQRSVLWHVYNAAAYWKSSAPPKRHSLVGAFRCQAFRISFPHFGQDGPVSVCGSRDIGFCRPAKAVTGERVSVVGLGLDLWTLIISCTSSVPSISRISFFLANSVASTEKRPEVTMMAESIFSLCRRPNNSRTIATPTCCRFQCLHCTINRVDSFWR